MSSSPELRARPGAGPRVGILRGLTTSNRPVTPERHIHLTGPQTVAEAHDARRDAEEAGYADGYAAGLAAVEAAHQQQLADFADTSRSALDALVQAVGDLRARDAAGLVHIADQTAALALDIARSILQREIDTATDPGRDAIARAMTLVPEEGPATVRLHPDDRARLGQIDDLLPDRDISIIADPAVEPGGCVVQVEATRVDAQLSTALDRIAEVLR